MSFPGGTIPYHPDATVSRWLERLLVFAAIALISSWRSLQIGDGTITDPYHQGEHFAAVAFFDGAGSGPPPVTIHGALDYLPGLAAKLIFGESRYFLPTIVAYSLLSIASALLFMWLVGLATRPMGGRLWVLLAMGLVAPILVGYRDVVLLSCILLHVAREGIGSRRLAALAEGATGILLAFGLFWSFDRGMAGAVAIGASCIARLVEGRGGQWTLVAFAVSVPFVGMFPSGNSIPGYIDNIGFLVDTSSQWSYGWTVEAIAVTALLGVATAWALWMLVANLRMSSQPASLLGNSVMLAVLCFFFFRIGTNRADAHHLLMGLWAPLLTALFAYGSQPDLRQSPVPRLGAGTVACGLLVAGHQYGVLEFLPLAAVLLVNASSTAVTARQVALARVALGLAAASTAAVAVGSVIQGAVTGGYGWIRALGTLPDDKSRVSDGVRWVVGELERARVPCVFDLSNNGVINGLARLPGCTRFAYLVYASGAYEAEMINSLAASRPGAIVYASQSWTYAIDGKPMPDRFPELHRFIARHYAEERCESGYCLRYLGSPDGIGHQ